jgi:hypothetical protein
VPEAESIAFIGAMKGRAGSEVDVGAGWPGQDLGGRGVGLIVEIAAEHHRAFPA